MVETSKRPRSPVVDLVRALAIIEARQLLTDAIKPFRAPEVIDGDVIDLEEMITKKKRKRSNKNG